MAPAALAIALLATTTAAFAANSAQIKVIGTITPAACGATLTGSGTFDYGTISAGILSDTKATNLGARTNILTIACPSAATRVALAATDNVADTKDTSDGVAQALGTDYIRTYAKSGA